VQTFQITITGQVQGVGFRPFVFNLAKRYGFTGQVGNTENGVKVQVNGQTDKVMAFVEDIVHTAPGVSVIQSHQVDPSAFIAFEDFSIAPSTKDAKVALPLTADFAICKSCQEEIRDPSNHRFQYPFTSCTQCGPRYSITRRFPFERRNTTLSDFEMCESCESEYSDPTDRRFHSQTNSCPDCGIPLQLLDAKGIKLGMEQGKIIETTAKLLSQGAIVAIKNTGGYLLCVDANNRESIERLRNRKQRPTKPFALLYPSLERIGQDFEVNDREAKGLTSTIGPIVILQPRGEHKTDVSQNVAPGMGNFGVMLPSSGLLTLLMDQLRFPMVATSGNIHGSPILSTNSEALEQLNGVADYFLQHDLDIAFPQDDSVIRFAGEHRIVLRRSRGMAPNFLTYRSGSKEPVMAMGAHLKSTVAFTPNAHTYVSPYFGNLDNYDVLQRISDTVKEYTQLFETTPSVVLVDKHPHYQSTQLGMELAGGWNAKSVQIQHHKAHFASVLAEHALFDSKEHVLGVVWDGTGLGDDGMVWGGEFFSYQHRKMARTAHFEYFDWLAGDKMAREPRLSLFSLLSEEYHKELQSKFSPLEWKLYQQIKANNMLKTSSVGRLFDAVACLLDIQDVTTFEGEAAMRLENRAVQNGHGPLLDLLAGEDPGPHIPTRKIMERLCTLKQQGNGIGFLAASFIHTLAMIVVRMAKKHHFKIVACSGGVFQNAFLVRQLMELSLKNGITLKLNKELSSNDENIALGQLAYFENIKQ